MSSISLKNDCFHLLQNMVTYLFYCMVGNIQRTFQKNHLTPISDECTCASHWCFTGVYMFINWVMIWSMSYYWVVHVCLTHVLPGYTCMSYWCFTGLYYTSSWAIQVHVLLNIVGFNHWLLTLHVATQIFNNLCLSLLFLLKLLLQLFFHFGLFVLFLRYLSCIW